MPIISCPFKFMLFVHRINLIWVALMMPYLKSEIWCHLFISNNDSKYLNDIEVSIKFWINWFDSRFNSWTLNSLQTWEQSVRLSHNMWIFHRILLCLCINLFAFHFVCVSAYANSELFPTPGSLIFKEMS